MAVTSLGTVTSALIATASPPAAAMVATTSSAWGALARWLTATRYPCLARTNAVAAPMPRLAPVITATRATPVTSACAGNPRSLSHVHLPPGHTGKFWKPRHAGFRHGIEADLRRDSIPNLLHGAIG